MEKLVVTMVAVAILGCVVCGTMMFAALCYGFHGQCYLDGFAVCAAVLILALVLLCKKYGDHIGE